MTISIRMRMIGMGVAGVLALAAWPLVAQEANAEGGLVAAVINGVRAIGDHLESYARLRDRRHARRVNQ